MNTYNLVSSIISLVALLVLLRIFYLYNKEDKLWEQLKLGRRDYGRYEDTRPYIINEALRRIGKERLLYYIFFLTLGILSWYRLIAWFRE